MNESHIPQAHTAAPAKHVTPEKDTLKVYLRVKPLTSADVAGGEQQDVLAVVSDHDIVLCPPKLSKAFKVSMHEESIKD